MKRSNLSNVALLLLPILFLSLVTNAQDFTDEIIAENHDTTKHILVIPLKSQFLLSEIDNGISKHSNLDILEVRTEIIQAISIQMSDLYEKSNQWNSLQSCRVLNRNADAGSLTYIRKEFSYGYQEAPEEEPVKKKKFFQKKEKPVSHGNKTSIQNGQIVQKPIFKEQYMAAKIRTKGVLTFIQEEYNPDLIVVITEFDLRKNRVMPQEQIDAAQEKDYVATMHYSLIDKNGTSVGGNKVKQYFDRSSFKIDMLKRNVINTLCEAVYQNSMLYLNPKSVEVAADEEDDY